MGYYKCQNDKMTRVDSCFTCKYKNDSTHASECKSCIDTDCSMNHFLDEASGCAKCLHEPKAVFRLIDKDFLDEVLLPRDCSGGIYGFRQLQEILKNLDENCMEIVFCKDCIHKFTENCPMSDMNYEKFGFCHFGEAGD